MLPWLQFVQPALNILIVLLSFLFSWSFFSTVGLLFILNILYAVLEDFIPVPEGRLGNQALVTGASYGIGLELAKLLAKDGCNLVLIARSEDVLNGVAKELRTFGISVKVIAKDLSQSSAPQEIFDELKKENIEIDLLVNNAGIGINSPLHQADVQKHQQMIQINVTALTELTHLFVKGMVERKRGHIMNLASTAGLQPGPLMSGYYASKAYVINFSLALDAELRGTGVSVSCVCPGATHTEFAQRAGHDSSTLFRFTPVMSAAEVARIGYEAAKRKGGFVITGLANKILSMFVPFLPTFLTMNVAHILNSKH